MREIVGNGAIAKTLEGVEKDFLFFASGVANSKEEKESEYDREKELLLNQDKDKHIVYFSSLCIFTQPETRYSQHKIEMEDLIRENFPHYTILRLGNCEFATNPHQLIPFIKSKLENGEQFPVFDEYRHLVTKEEFLYWVNLIPERNCEMSIGQRLKVADIVERYKDVH